MGLVEDTDAQSLAITEQTSARMQAFESTLRGGVGGEAIRHYRELKETTSMLPGKMREVADTIAEIRADTSLPQEHRTLRINEIRRNAQSVVAAVHQAAAASAAALEVELTTRMKPKPSSDTGERQLIRDEIKTRLTGKQGAGLMDQMVKELGRSSRYDGELLSEWGKAFMEGNGAGSMWKAFEKAAVGTLLTLPTTGTQEAARLALKTFREFKVSAAPDVFQQAALTQLRRGQ